MGKMILYILGMLVCASVVFAFGFSEENYGLKSNIVPQTNYSTVNVNNSYFWQGYTPTTFTTFLGGNFLALDGSNANQNINIGFFNLTLDTLWISNETLSPYITRTPTGYLLIHGTSQYDFGGTDQYILFQEGSGQMIFSNEQANIFNFTGSGSWITLDMSDQSIRGGGTLITTDSMETGGYYSAEQFVAGDTGYTDAGGSYTLTNEDGMTLSAMPAAPLAYIKMDSSASGKTIFKNNMLSEHTFITDFSSSHVDILDYDTDNALYITDGTFEWSFSGATGPGWAGRLSSPYGDITYADADGTIDSDKCMVFVSSGQNAYDVKTIDKAGTYGIKITNNTDYVILLDKNNGINTTLGGTFGGDLRANNYYYPNNATKRTVTTSYRAGTGSAYGNGYTSLLRDGYSDYLIAHVVMPEDIIPNSHVEFYWPLVFQDGVNDSVSVTLAGRYDWVNSTNDKGWSIVQYTHKCHINCTSAQDCRQDFNIINATGVNAGDEFAIYSSRVGADGGDTLNQNASGRLFYVKYLSNTVK